jgi:hypothetical protein
MAEYVRVREGRWEYTLRKGHVPKGVTVLKDKDPLSPSGKPAPPKPVTDLGTPAPGSKQERKRAAKKTSAAKSRGVDAGQTSAKPETEN